MKIPIPIQDSDKMSSESDILQSVVVTLAVVADYAGVDSAGKINIIGAFSDIYTASLPDAPAILSQACILATIEGSPIEAGKDKTFQVTIKGRDAQETVFDYEFTQTLPESNPGTPVRMNLVIQLQNLSFPRAGDYQVYFLINGEHKRDIPIRVHEPIKEEKKKKP